MAFQQTSPFFMFGRTPILQVKRFEKSGVNQFGLIPKTPYDFANATNLVNFGRGTDENSLHVRRGLTHKGPDSSPAFQSNAVGKNMTSFTGLKDGEHSMSFCRDETFALRLCMARGTSNCQRENAALTGCIAQAAPLKRAIQDMHMRYRDWFQQAVSENYTIDFQHRKQDWKHHYWQEKVLYRRLQGGRAFGRHKKVIYWNAKSRNAGTQYATKSRLPVNK